MTIISFELSQNIILREIHENQLYDTHQARVRPKSFCIGQNFDRILIEIETMSFNIQVLSIIAC